eukprot:2364972-Pyramimonas_sp.AAC.1
MLGAGGMGLASCRIRALSPSSRITCSTIFAACLATVAGESGAIRCRGTLCTVLLLAVALRTSARTTP